jgi:hypothetical protein
MFITFERKQAIEFAEKGERTADSDEDYVRLPRAKRKTHT